MKLEERFQAEKFNSTCDDPHCDITTDAEDVQPNSLDDQKRADRSTGEDDELVKYMSNLPCFLKTGESIKEKAFSVGVLDWRRLEKWQHSKKHTVFGTSRYSTSSTGTSSSHSTEASSSHSSRGRSCSPVNQKKIYQPTTRPCPEAFSVKTHGETIKSTGGVASAVEGRKSEKPKSTHVNGGMVRSCPKEKTEVPPQERKCGKTAGQAGQSNAAICSSDLTERHDRVVILMPSSSGTLEGPQFPDSTACSEEKSSAGPCQGSIPGKHSDVHPGKFDFSFSKIKRTVSLFDGPRKLPPDVPGSLPMPARASVSPHRSINARLGTSNIALLHDDTGKSLKGLDPKACKTSSEKVRSSSPFRRFSITVGKVTKSSSPKEASTSLNSSSECTSASSCVENIELSAPSTARARSSPLRRLLDPLLKPKMSNRIESEDPSGKISEVIDQLARSPKRRSDSSAAQPAKAKLDLTSCKSINVDNSHLERKSGSSVAQALLRVAIKNGLPLFTFAVDNDGDIFAATMKECSGSSVKDNPSWIYTFFMIREVKKKNKSWMNQGGKGKGQGYAPNVVAQMKVSDSLSSNLREFVLFSVEPRKQNQNTSDFQPNDELAAIVSQIPLGLYPCSIEKGHQGAVADDLGDEDLANTTVILPGGFHSLPSNGGPSSLIQRWRSGGACDCGGWDLGCQLKVLKGDHHLGKKPNSAKASSATDHFALFPQVDTLENLPEFTLAPFKDGIYSIEFNSSLSVLQAFSVCIAVLESRQMIQRPGDQSLGAAKCSGATVHSANGDVPGKYVSNPPLSPVGRV